MKVLVRTKEYENLVDLTRVPVVGERVYGFGLKRVVDVTHIPAAETDFSEHGSPSALVLLE